MERLGIVCHDAGGAEIISHYVKNNELQIYAFLKGPAKKIFKRVLNIESVENLKIILERCNTIIFGTSWQSDLEKESIIKAKKNNKKTIVLIDHWIDYKSRLFYKDRFLKPDEIWVVDEYAFKKVKREFGDINISTKKNYYLKNMVRQITSKKIPSDISQNILFIGENISGYLRTRYENENKWKYNEFSSLNFLLENINFLNLNNPKITIRPHPSENIDKYLSYLKDFPHLSIEFSIETNLADDICKSEVVVGSESMALVVALLSGKRVISSIPALGKACSLPFKGIEKMTDLIAV